MWKEKLVTESKTNNKLLNLVPVYMRMNSSKLVFKFSNY